MKVSSAWKSASPSRHEAKTKREHPSSQESGRARATHLAGIRLLLRTRKPPWPELGKLEPIPLTPCSQNYRTWFRSQPSFQVSAINRNGSAQAEEIIFAGETENTVGNRGMLLVRFQHRGALFVLPKPIQTSEKPQSVTKG